MNQVIEFLLYVQKLLTAAKAGGLHGSVTARIQGPFDGHIMPPAEMDNVKAMLVVSGGVGLPAVLAALQRLALHRTSSSASGTLLH